ncbi:MAG: helix-turn-helix domain-containing protein, partial [Nitrospira sp.]|nr:helix-turn-helix domain-containing protein [Nitrospira sp.]
MPSKCYTHLSAEDRETVSLGLAHGHSLRRMARVLGRSPSTISRESARNATRGHPYRACTAQTLARARACQPRRSRKLVDPWLWQHVQTQLLQGCLSRVIQISPVRGIENSPPWLSGRRRFLHSDKPRFQFFLEPIG